MSHDPQSPTDAADFDDDEAECCEECGAPLDGGEGWDGLCGACADLADDQ